MLYQTISCTHPINPRLEGQTRHAKLSVVVRELVSLILVGNPLIPVALDACSSNDAFALAQG